MDSIGTQFNFFDRNMAEEKRIAEGEKKQTAFQRLMANTDPQKVEIPESDVSMEASFNF